MPAWTSAAASTLAYGVITVGGPEGAALSRDSHAPAARLAGSLAAPVQPGPVPAWYGRVIVWASPSRAGAMTQVRPAPGCACPAASRADRRPPGPRLADRSLFVSPAHTWWCGWSM